MEPAQPGRLYRFFFGGPARLGISTGLIVVIGGAIIFGIWKLVSGGGGIGTVTVKTVSGTHPPLSFSVRYDEEGFIVVGIPRHAAEHLVDVQGCADLEETAREAGGADPQRTMLAVDVHGRLADTSAIIGMRAVVLSRTEPVEGAEAFCEGGSEVSPLRLTFDLESRNPVAQRTTGSEDRPRLAGPLFVHNRQIQAAEHEDVPLLLAGVVTSHVVTWRIEVTAMVGMNERTFTIDDHGRPFRTSPQKGGVPVYRWRLFAHPPDLVVSKRD